MKGLKWRPRGALPTNRKIYYNSRCIVADFNINCGVEKQKRQENAPETGQKIIN